MCSNVDGYTEVIIPSEGGQTEKDKSPIASPTAESEKMNQMNYLLKTTRLTDTENKLAVKRKWSGGGIN